MNNLFSSFRAPVTLIAVIAIFVGIAACSSVTDYSSGEEPAIPAEALSGEITPELSNEITPKLNGDLILQAPVKPKVAVPPVKPVIKSASVKPHLKVSSGNINLKGEGTISVSMNLAKPLYIVDGKEYSDFKLSDIEPRQIESIEVLRGAAAKAIYGAQAKDGAVIVTKKDQDRE